MAFECHIARPFSHQHETKMFGELTGLFKKRFTSEPGRHILLGNILCNTSEFDAIFLKPRGIAIIEMKAHGGRIQFSENGEWKSDGKPVKGGTKINPYVQVRTSRISLRRWLQELSNRAELHPRPPYAWEDIAAIVLFSGNIELNGIVNVPPLNCWFTITDLCRCTEVAAQVKSRELIFSNEEFDQILIYLGITFEPHNYQDSYNNQKINDKTQCSAIPDAQQRKLKVYYVREFGFREHELAMRSKGGLHFEAAVTVRQWFEEIRKGNTPLSNIPFREDARIPTAKFYKMSASHELVCIEIENFGIPTFFGTQPEIDTWVRTHQGIHVTIDTKTLRINITRISNAIEVELLHSPAISIENRPYINRISNLKLEDIITQRKVREIICQLNEDSSEVDIKETLELISDQDLQLFLFDVISLIRNGDINGAETRVKLRSGEALPAEDCVDLAIESAESEVNSDQILLINDLSKEDLDRLLSPERFQEWMLFLHPDQKQLVEATYDKPVVLHGVSGSGKTCILVHRARYLAKRYPGTRIGIVTLSEPLSRLLQKLVNLLCSEEERKNIIVLPFYEQLRNCLGYLGLNKYCTQITETVSPESGIHKTIARVLERWPNSMVWDCDPISNVKVEEEWDDFFLQRNPSIKEWLDAATKPLEAQGIDASKYLFEELTLLRSSFPIPTREKAYLEMERSGRTIPFFENSRKVVLKVAMFWEDWLLDGGMLDALGLTLASLPMHHEMLGLPENLRFRSLLIDEFQDLSSLDLQILRRMVTISEPDSLFIAGDTVQKILLKSLSLGGGVGLDRGPAYHKIIKKNYRNSRQILRAAAKLANLYGEKARRQGEEINILDPELAQRETNAPIVIKTNDQVHKAWDLILDHVAGKPILAGSCCIATAAPKRVTVNLIENLCPLQIEVKRITAVDDQSYAAVTVGELGELKGFEFSIVIILACEEGFFPDPGMPSEESWRDALRLYVAMTRARDLVYIIYQDYPSEFISGLSGFVTHVTQPVESFRVETRGQIKSQLAVTKISNHDDKISQIKPSSIIPARILKNVHPSENIESKFSKQEIEVLRRYFAKNVLGSQLCFSQWFCQRELSNIDGERLFGLRGIRRGVLNDLSKKLLKFGLITVQSQRTVIPTVGKVERKRSGQCSAAGCYSNQISGDRYCYYHHKNGNKKP
jgi:superfamily I DNA/RNA helicase